MDFATTSPATGEVLRVFDNHSIREVEQRVCQAAAAAKVLRTMPNEQRSRLMLAVARLLDSDARRAATLLTTEMGKTLVAAGEEVKKCVDTMRWFAENAAQILANKRIDERTYVEYQPLGVILAVMPWNFPMWQVIRSAVPAIIAGNAVILKHAPNVPQSAQYLEELFLTAGFPAGTLTSLFIETDRIAALIDDERVAAITLTGSERAGAAVAQLAGRALKKCALELGGSDPFIVTSSADVQEAAMVGVLARIQNNGQACVAAKRFIIEAPVYEEFCELFIHNMAEQVVGNPMDVSTNVGPLATEQQRIIIACQVADACQKGATVACGGRAPAGPGWYYEPTILLDVTPDMRVLREEVFGPVATVEKARDLDDVIQRANRTQYGLGCSVWTGDVDVSSRLVAEIDSGLIFVNAMVTSSAELPFGGIKRSGWGRELGALGATEFCNAKSVRWAPSARSHANVGG